MTTRLRILHISDTHGLPPEPAFDDYDVVVHSGDLLPNRSYGNRQIEEVFQEYWLKENILKLHHRWWSKPFFYTPGNHDFIDPTPIMREAGLDARLLCNGALEHQGVRFWGHPWTPTFCDWNWMCGPREMREHLNPAIELMDRGEIDVFVSHGPVHRILDRTQDGDYAGCKVLREALTTAAVPPRWLLHGHIHEAQGLRVLGTIKVSNAARCQTVVTVE